MSTIRDQMKAAIYGQESSSGKADTSQENYAGARGPMQVTRKTFEGMKSKGLIPNDYDHANPEHTRDAGNRLIDSLADQFGDDPRKVAAAYYSGPKAIRADGSIADFRDLKNPKAPTTLQYVADIERRMGTSTVAATSGAGSTLAPSPLNVREAPTLDDWSNIPMPARTDKAAAKASGGGKEALEPLPKAEPFAGGPNPLVASLEARQAAEEKADAEYDSVGFLEIAQRQAAWNGLTGVVIRALGREPAGEPLAGYIPREANPELYAGRSEDDHQLLDEAVNPQHALRLSAEIDMREEDMRVAASHGTGMMIAAGFVGGLPEGMIAGYGAARAFQLAKVGSAALAAQGQKGAAIASNFAEQAVGNVGAVALQAAFDPYTSVEDGAMALGFSFLGTGLSARGLAREADAVHIREVGQRAMDVAAARMQATHAKAVANLGEGATPEALRTEMARIEGNDIRATITSATSAVGEDRRLIPDMETLHAEERVKLEAEEAAKAEGLKAETSGMAAGSDLPVLDMNWQPEAPVVKGGKPVTDPSTVLIGNIGMMNTWNMAHGDRLMEAAKSAANRPGIERGMGMTIEALEALPNGVHLNPTASNGLPPAALKTLKWLHEKFLPDTKIVLGRLDGSSLGVHGKVFDNASYINIKAEGWGTTLVHEFGHAILAHALPKANANVNSALKKFHGEWVRRYSGRADATPREGLNPRESVMLEHSGIETTNLFGANRKLDQPAGQEASLFDVLSQAVTPDGKPRPAKDVSPLAKQQAKEYFPNFDEMGAEQFGKYIEAALAGEGPWRPTSMPKELLGYIQGIWTKLVDLFTQAKKHNLLRADTSFEQFFEGIRKSVKGKETKARREAAGLNPDRDAAPSSLMAEASKLDVGQDIMPQVTAMERAEAKAVVAIHEKAEKWAAKNIIDTTRMSKLLKNTVFDPISTVMLRSQNNVVRMVAGELLENGGGSAGRRSTAAIGKWMHEREFMGNTINDIQMHYTQWRNLQGGNAWGDYADGKLWRAFNRQVAEHIESQKPGATAISSSPQVMKAAEVLTAGYERMRLSQTKNKTTGWASLPETSQGYMPHRMSREVIQNLTLAQTRALHSALVDQFIQIEGFDATFSANLASKYIDRVRTSANGGYDAPGGVHQVGAAEVVEDALKQMNLTKGEITAMMGRYMQAGPGHTKRRLQLDLLAEHDDGAGGTFTLMDMFETDQLKLIRSQAQRVSGEVALAQHGIMGKPGLALLRRAMEFGEGKASVKELEAFDQAAAEFLAQPFGTTAGKWAERAMEFNSLARLGGMGFQQAAEYINGAFHVGAMAALKAVVGLPRLRSEAMKLARGEKVHNPILTSLEIHGGAEFGTDAYKMVFPFDPGSLEHQLYGHDTPHMADRVLRGASQIQSKLSFWRAIHSAQHRGLAEQVVHKAVKYIRDGKDDIALNEMGIGPALRAELLKDLPAIAKFDAAGNLVEFDITKVSDPKVGAEFVQAVHRGGAQMIQGTFIGETGKWAHSGFLRLLTQFRTFSITSVEKQWARQAGSRGTAAAIGILMGSMSVAVPIHIARVHAAAMFRKDREEYLERRLSAYALGKATLNYVSMSGLAGDLMDAFSATTGIGAPTGGRGGAMGQSFVGNVVAPAAGLADDLYKGIQNTKEGTNPVDLLKAMPFSKLPYLIPALNALEQ